MSDEPLVLDSSVVLKWVIPETDSLKAWALRKFRILAPDLLAPECANALWKQVRRGELSAEEAMEAAQILQLSDIELTSARPLAPRALEIAIALDHPIYDCVYIALAEREDCGFVTADRRLITRLAAASFKGNVMALDQMRI